MNHSVDLQDRCNSVNWTETDRDREWEWGDLRLLVYCSECVYRTTTGYREIFQVLINYRPQT